MKSRNVTAENLKITWPKNHDKAIDYSSHHDRKLMFARLENIVRGVVSMKCREFDIQ